MLSILERGSLACAGEGRSRVCLRVNVLIFLIDALNLIVVTAGRRLAERVGLKVGINRRWK